MYGLNGAVIFILNENFRKETLFVVNQKDKKERIHAPYHFHLNNNEYSHFTSMLANRTDYCHSSAWICESNKQIIKITGLVYLNVQARIL